jgi:hypothetical protein
VLVTGQRAERAPADRPVLAGCGDRDDVGPDDPVGAELEERDAGTHAHVGLVDLAGDDQQVARGDGQQPLGAVGGGQHLGERGLGRVGHVVDRDQVAALGSDEGVGDAVVRGVGQALGLGALVVGAAVVEAADGEHQVLDGGAGVPDDLAGRGLEDRPAAAAALPVALVGGGDQTVADPVHGVGLARDVDGVGGVEDAVVGGVHALEHDVAGAEGAGDLAGGQVDDDQAVVLLQAHNELVVGVDVDVLRLGVLGGVHARQVLDRQQQRVRGPGGGGAVELEHLHEAGGGLRQVALVRVVAGTIGQGVLVALVLHRDRGVLARGAHRDRVRLAAEVVGGDELAGPEVDDVDAARGLGVARGGVDDHEHVVADDGDRGRLVLGVTELAEVQRAQALGGGGVADVEEADPLARGVGVDHRLAVLADCGDLRNGLVEGVHALGDVEVDRVRRQPAEPLDRGVRGLREGAGPAAGLAAGLGGAGHRAQRQAGEGQGADRGEREPASEPRSARDPGGVLQGHAAAFRGGWGRRAGPSRLRGAEGLHRPRNPTHAWRRGRVGPGSSR